MKNFENDIKPNISPSPKTQSYPVTRIADQPELIEKAAAWFSEKWSIPIEEYLTNMQDSCQQTSISNSQTYFCRNQISTSQDHRSISRSNTIIPQWYVISDGKCIVAGAGVIENDFHERIDLTPNICAVFVEPNYRGLGLSRLLLDHICQDMAYRGIHTLYLLTDHDSYYEKLGWTFREMVRDTEGELGRMYEKTTETINSPLSY